MDNTAQAFDRIRADLAVIAADRPKPAARFARLRGDLLGVQTRSARRAAFRDGAEAFFARVFAAPDYPGLAEAVDRTRDPAWLATSLLGSLNRSRRETLHTQALAGLLDPQRCEHGASLLRALLEEIRPELTGGVDLKATSVWAERSLDLPTRGRTQRPRPDLVIELRAAQGRAPCRVVVIENKIGALDRDRQLDDYSEAANLRYPEADIERVYLTIHGDAPTQEVESAWHSLSYEALALALRRQLAILDRHEPTSRAWREVLRLYLATVVQDLLRWRIFNQRNRAAQWRAQRYLRAAAEPVNTND